MKLPHNDETCGWPRWKVLYVQALYILDSKAPRLVSAIFLMHILLPWWRDRAILNALHSVWPAAMWFCRIGLTTAGKARLLEWFDRNYSSAAFVRKYPWLKYARE